MTTMKVRVRLLDVMFRSELVRGGYERAAALCLAVVVAPSSGLGGG